MFQDICGIICAVLTWLLILYAEFVVMMVMLLPGVSTYPVYSYINIFIFQSLAFLAFASHLRTMFTDPVSTKCNMFLVSLSYFFSLISFYTNNWEYTAQIFCSNLKTIAPIGYQAYGPLTWN